MSTSLWPPRLDEMAFAGYRYATQGGPLPLIRDEMDLLAFNAGVSNANHLAGTHADPLPGFTVKPSEPAGLSDKELAICSTQ